MTAIKASRTEANLKYAFAAETLASRYYQACAARADAEGFHRAAALFRAIAGQRSAQATRHLEILEAPPQGLGYRADRGTTDNLRSAISDALQEHADLYPAMIRTAREEQLDEIAAWFEILAKTGRAHAVRFRRVLETML